MLLISQSPTSHLAYPGPAPTILLGVKTLCFSSPGCSRQHRASSWPYAETLVGRASCFLLPKLFHSLLHSQGPLDRLSRLYQPMKGNPPKNQRQHHSWLCLLCPGTCTRHPAPTDYPQKRTDLLCSLNQDSPQDPYHS